MCKRLGPVQVRCYICRIKMFTKEILFGFELLRLQAHPCWLILYQCKKRLACEVIDTGQKMAALRAMAISKERLDSDISDTGQKIAALTAKSKRKVGL